MEPSGLAALHLAYALELESTVPVRPSPFATDAPPDHRSVARVLLATGARVNLRKRPLPLHYTAQDGESEISSSLLGRNADHRLSDKYGRNAKECIKPTGPRWPSPKSRVMGVSGAVSGSGKKPQPRDGYAYDDRG